jgi:hypothetical protein
MCAIGAIAVAIACGGDNSEDDGGVDGSVDGTTDAKADTGTDAKADAKTDGAVDAGSDATTDASSDAPVDAVVDAPDDSPSDAGIDAPIVDSGTDANVTCGSKQGFGYVSTGDSGICGTGEDYMCSTDAYEILCECPAATCTCFKNKVDAGTATYNGCPSCTTNPNFSVIAASCGIPY